MWTSRLVFACDKTCSSFFYVWITFYTLAVTISYLGWLKLIHVYSLGHWFYPSVGRQQCGLAGRNNSQFPWKRWPTKNRVLLAELNNKLNKMFRHKNQKKKQTIEAWIHCNTTTQRKISFPKKWSSKESKYNWVFPPCLIWLNAGLNFHISKLLTLFEKRGYG